MERRLLLEGDDIDELLRRVRQDHGHEARIVNAEEKLVGGVRGFFAKRRYEVAISLDDHAEGSLGAAAGPTTEAMTPEPRDPWSDRTDRSDVTAHEATGLDLGHPPAGDPLPGRPAPAGRHSALAERAHERRPQPITSLEQLMAAAGQLDGGPETSPRAAVTPPAVFEPAEYRRPSTPRHAAPAGTSGAAGRQDVDPADRPTVFDELMRDLTARPVSAEVPDVRRPPAPEPPGPTRRSPRVMAPEQIVAAPRQQVTAPLPPGDTIAYAAPDPTARVAADVAALVALGMPAPQADPRIALLDVLTGVAVRAPHSLSGVHLVVGDPVAAQGLAATWLRLCAVEESTSIHLTPTGAHGDGLDALREHLPAALDGDGGALVLIDAGPSRAQARRAARQVQAVCAELAASGMSDAGVTVTVTALLDARWDLETAREWLARLGGEGHPITDLAAHGVCESAVPLRLLGHGLRVSWLDGAPATLGAWAGPCLDRMG